MFRAALARLGVLLSLCALVGLAVAGPAAAAPTKHRPPPKAHMAACQYAGGRLVPIGARERKLANCLESSRMTHAERQCFIDTIGTAFGVMVGALIPPAEAPLLAKAIIGGGAGACLSVVLGSL